MGVTGRRVPLADGVSAGCRGRCVQVLCEFLCQAVIACKIPGPGHDRSRHPLQQQQYHHQQQQHRLALPRDHKHSPWVPALICEVVRAVCLGWARLGWDWPIAAQLVDVVFVGLDGPGHCHCSFPLYQLGKANNLLAVTAVRDVESTVKETFLMHICYEHNQFSNVVLNITSTSCLDRAVQDFVVVQSSLLAVCSITDSLRENRVSHFIFQQLTDALRITRYGH